MGAGVSAGENNDDLIDNLIEANYIKTSLVERVFRAVDRGAYFLPQPPADAYRDVAWKNGNFHISAPCIYSEVMEGLKLKPGLSFLNLGAGTGYLSTIAGLILGSYGINHGVELHEDVIHYAYTRLEEFKKHSGAIDEFDFCEPKFIQGNCLCLSPDFPLYDRIYCGAACPEKYIGYMQNLIKVGGILVMPINERLVEMRRVSENNWTTHYLLPVSFTNLIRPEQGSEQIVSTFDIEPLSLQELSRTAIRDLLRRSIEGEHPEVKSAKKKSKSSKKKKPVKRDRNGRRDPPRSSEELLDFFLLTIARKKKRLNVAQDRECSSSSANDEASSDDNSSVSCHSEENAASTSSDTKTQEAGGSKEEKTEVVVHRGDEDEAMAEGPSDQKVSYDITLVKPEHKSNRDKFDSGLGDELISEIPLEMVSSSSDEEFDGKRCKRVLKEKDRKLSVKWRKLDKIDSANKCESDSSDNEDKSDSESEVVEPSSRLKMYASPYSAHMKEKIQQLPLPSNVKKFLNFYREL